jgi:dihydrolipoamide dehydrogenase
MSENADLVVIGAGPGGYAAAFRAADLGRSVTLIDPRATLGGVCLNEGCIPSKALLHAAETIRGAAHMNDWGIGFAKPKIDLDRLREKKDGIVGQLTGGLGQLARKRKVRVVKGTAVFSGKSTLTVSDGKASEEIRFDQAIIACGSDPIALPGWPKDDPRIMNSQGALDLAFIPERLTIVGGGIIGLEMATVYSALGSAVTIVELADQIAPGADAEAAKILLAAMKDHGCTVHTKTRVESLDASGKAITLTVSGEQSGMIKADAVIQAVGRRANGHRVAADKAGIEIAKDGTIAVDVACRSSAANIFAVGDVTGGPMLAHRATHQGKVAAEAACGHNAAFDTPLIPSVAYTDPELAWVGLTVERAKADKIAHKVTKFPWAASGRNLASGGRPGMTKIVYAPDTGRILGATIVGPHAGELLAELTLAIEMGATLEDLALTVHAHPTLSETPALAAELALGTCTDL